MFVIKQSKGLGRNQTIKIPRIPLSHPTGFQNQNNQNPGKIPGNGQRNTAAARGPQAALGARGVTQQHPASRLNGRHEILLEEATEQMLLDLEDGLETAVAEHQEHQQEQ